ncbi:hypothetical protein PR048_006541 [Dryococelus australis]|uniref:Uncharacterized protein n=1 Tax=Dryococelus australis TaxID=614101 RepID=A0ABQ9IB89_9NEOP|nr:hypothetical protein PR048_006541 [Dryococelus australis]
MKLSLNEAHVKFNPRCNINIHGTASYRRAQTDCAVGLVVENHKIKVSQFVNVHHEVWVFSEINHKFVFTGLSFLPCDDYDALVECQGKNNEGIKHITASVKARFPFTIIEKAGLTSKSWTSLHWLTQYLVANSGSQSTFGYSWNVIKRQLSLKAKSHSILLP